MKPETLMPAKNMIIASFEAQRDAEQVYETLQLLRRDGQREIDAFLFTNCERDGLQCKQLGENLDNHCATPTANQLLPKLVEENEVIGNLIRSLSPSASVLLVSVSDDESRAIMVTFIAIIMAGSQ